MATYTKILKATERNLIVAAHGDAFTAIGLTSETLWPSQGCTAGGAELIGLQWSIPSGKTLVLKFGGVHGGETAAMLNDSGQFFALMKGAAGVKNSATGPSGQMEIIVPAALAANTYYTVIMEFARGPSGRAVV